MSSPPLSLRTQRTIKSGHASSGLSRVPNVNCSTWSRAVETAFCASAYDGITEASAAGTATAKRATREKRMAVKWDCGDEGSLRESLAVQSSLTSASLLAVKVPYLLTSRSRLYTGKRGPQRCSSPDRICGQSEGIDIHEPSP